MVKIKKYLLLSLIFLQFIAPFIHAHAFGYDSSKEHTFHLHADKVASESSSESSSITSQITNQSSTNSSLNLAQIGDNQIISAITTVANGIKTSVADDIADGIAVIAILFTFVFLVFNASARHVWQPIQALTPQRYFYVLQNPRAPPR